MTELQTMQADAVTETINRLAEMHSLSPSLRHDLRVELLRLAGRRYVVARHAWDPPLKDHPFTASPNVVNGTCEPSNDALWKLLTEVTCQQCGRSHPRGAMCVCMGPQQTPAMPATGWTCPRCSYVWGPHVTGCVQCNGKEGNS